jgi:hypothetical protein
MVNSLMHKFLASSNVSKIWRLSCRHQIHTRIKSGGTTPSRYARKDLNAAYSDQQHAHRLQVEQQKALDDKLERDYTHKIFSPQGAALTATQIENEMNAAGASATATQRMIGFYERQTKPDPASAVSAKNTSLLFDRINREWGDPTKVNDMTPVRQAFVNQEITKASYDFLEKQINDSKTVEGESLQKEKKRLFEMYKHSITKSNPLLGKFDDEGDIQFGRFERLVDQAVDQAKRKTEIHTICLMRRSQPISDCRHDVFKSHCRIRRQELRIS